MMQNKLALSESALPEELRLALAKSMQNDLFQQARGKNLCCEMWGTPAGRRGRDPTISVSRGAG